MRTRQNLNAVYRDAAEEFARQVVSALGEDVDSIVLYGSVALKQAKGDSDIDLLVIAEGPRVKQSVSDIAYGLMESSRFETFICTVHFTKSEFERLVGLGSPFIANVLQEGSILYDTGAFSRIRERLLSCG